MARGYFEVAFWLMPGMILIKIENLKLYILENL
jgi:hypothetical protein